MSSRIIPAYAGSTLPFPSNLLMISDHPRIRGEHENHAESETNLSGSSPHTRGAPSADLERMVGERIIPAYAGSTGATAKQLDEIGDHPRIRGEHRPIPEHCQMAEGSSPHTRGAPTPAVPSTKKGRIIPAYAGSTPPVGKVHENARDHPRIRGEHAGLNVDPRSDGGSSPHTRGAQ